MNRDDYNIAYPNPVPEGVILERNVHKIKAPVLNLIQTPNRLHAIYHLRSYADIKSPKKLIITPWTNENYQPWIFEATSFNQHILHWLDYWLRGIDTAIMDEPGVAIYDNGTGKWRYEDEFPLERTQWTTLYLREKTTEEDVYGNNSQVPPGKEKPDIYHNISLNTTLTTSYGLAGTLTEPEKPRNVAYISQPLEEDITVWGPVCFTLYASTTEEVTSDWSFFVKMGEMVPEGVPLNPVTGNPEIKPEVNDPWTPPEVQIWSWGSLKAKFRQVNKSMSRPGMPWHSFQNPEDIKPNTIYEFQIEMQPIFKTFRKGCRIWLKIASDDALYSTWDSSSGYVETPLSPVKAEISIYHDPEHPSHLLLPVIPDTPETDPVKPPLNDAVPGAPRFTE
jgi:putative CocE/NonD family hydrolase